MDGQWLLFNDLHPLGPISAVKGRCVRCYGMPSSTNANDKNTLELIFHDAEGVRFQFTVTRGLIEKFNTVFKEGEIYGIRDFVVTHSIPKYRTTSHNYRATMVKKTIVRVERDDAFPNKIFSFKSFADIKSMENIADPIPIDVIGVVVFNSGPKDFTTKNGANRRLIDLILEDAEGNKLDCTFWEEYIEECLMEFRKNTQDLDIIIVQLCKPTMYNGAIKVCNGYKLTKILLNRDIPEVHEFKQRLMINPSLSTTIISTTSRTTSTISEELSAGVQFLSTITELSGDLQGGIYWVCGTVVNFDTSEGWYHIACKKCRTKLKKVDHRFFCKKCNSYNASGSMRYRLIIHVVDESGSSPFLLWDRECLQLIGRSAAELNALKIEGVESTDLPLEIEEAFLRKKFMLKFKVTGGESWKYSIYNVSTLTDDPTVIATYSAKYINNQESDSVSVLESSNVAMENIAENTPIDPQSKLEISSEWIDDGSTKRCLMDEFSSTKAARNPKSQSRRRKSSNALRVVFC